MKKALAAALILLLTGCSIYTSEFQCRPGKGVGCAPVGEVLDMIVESEEGEDQFIKDSSTSRRSTSRQSTNRTAISKAKPIQRTRSQQGSPRTKQQRKVKSHKKKPQNKTLYLTKDETGQLVLQPEK